MAKTDIAWTGNCTDCINGVGPNESNRWVELFGGGKKDVGGILEGAGITDITFNTIDATFYGQRTGCTVSFKTEGGNETQCQVIRCPYVCSCGSFDIAVTNNKITQTSDTEIEVPKEGIIGTANSDPILFTIESKYGCPINDSTFEVSSNNNNIIQGLKLDNFATNTMNGATSASVKGKVPANSGDDTSQEIYFKHKTDNDIIICKTYHLGQESGIECGCDNLTIVISDNLKGDIPATGITDGTITITSTCSREGHTFDVIKEPNVDWVTINKKDNIFTITIKSNSDLKGRSANLQITSTFNGKSVECDGDGLIIINQSAAECSCDVFEWDYNYWKMITIEYSGVTDFVWERSKYYINTEGCNVNFVCHENSTPVSYATAKGEYNDEDGAYYVHLNVDAITECEKEREFHIKPMIGGKTCFYEGDHIRVKQTAKPCADCETAEVIFGEFPENNTEFVHYQDGWLKIDSGYTGNVLIAKIKRPIIPNSNNKSGKYGFNVLYDEFNRYGEWLPTLNYGNTGETGDGYITLSAKFDACTTDEWNRTLRNAWVTIWITRQDDGDTECKRVEIPIVQECEYVNCNVTISVEDNKQLDCDGGKVRFIVN